MIQVPDAMLETAVSAAMEQLEEVNDGYRGSSMGIAYERDLRKSLAATLQYVLTWQRDNAPVPTVEQLNVMYETHRKDTGLWNRFGSSTNPLYLCWQWVRIMYDVPKPEAVIPEALEDLMVYPYGGYTDESQLRACEENCSLHNQRVLEAYRRGQQAKG